MSATAERAREVAYAQMLELPFYNTFFRTTHPPVVKLSRKLAELAPTTSTKFSMARQARKRTTRRSV
jgi:adenosylmethionine-8-amino-7-oxononanoate aminotransferase